LWVWCRAGAIELHQSGASESLSVLPFPFFGAKCA